MSDDLNRLSYLLKVLFGIVVVAITNPVCIPYSLGLGVGCQSSVSLCTTLPLLVVRVLPPTIKRCGLSSPTGKNSLLRHFVTCMYTTLDFTSTTIPPVVVPGSPRDRVEAAYIITWLGVFNYGALASIPGSSTLSLLAPWSTPEYIFGVRLLAFASYTSRRYISTVPPR